MSVNSRVKATKILGQRTEFCRQRIPEFSCTRKETVDIDILVTSRNGGRKIMQSIRITSRSPSRKKTWNQLSQFRWASTKVIPIEKTYAGYISTMRVRERQGSRQTASEGPTALHIRFCNLSNNFRLQLGAPAQTWQQYSMHSGW